LTLRAQTVRDLMRLWPALDIRRLAETFPHWLVGASTIVGRDHRRAAELGVMYAQAHRLAAGVEQVAIELAPPPAPAKVATALRVTSVVAARRAIGAGKTPAAAMQSAFVQSSGAATRLALDGGRDTVARSAPRYQRVTSGGSCDFCRMLAGRGAVYYSDTVGFRSHDWCACVSEPVY